MRANGRRGCLWPSGVRGSTHGSRVRATSSPPRHRRPKGGLMGSSTTGKETGSTRAMAPDDRNELREGYAEVGDVRLHYVEAGDGPLIVLLHGFPEFWFSWRLQIGPLAAAGFRVVAPDLRGYNLSSRPADVEAYSADRLAADVRGLIRELGSESALLVGHDWGGTVAWATAMNHPEVVDHLVILNAAHPRASMTGSSTR